MNEQTQKLIKDSYDDFGVFCKWIFFKHSLTQYECPSHFIYWAKLFQQKRFVSLMSARKHLKSTLIYAYLMWKIFRNKSKNNLEILYLSYNGDLAAYHVANIKELIKYVISPLDGIIEKSKKLI